MIKGQVNDINGSDHVAILLGYCEPEATSVSTSEALSCDNFGSDLLHDLNSLSYDCPFLNFGMWQKYDGGGSISAHFGGLG